MIYVHSYQIPKKRKPPKMKAFDRYIIQKLFSITSLVLVVLIFIFVIIDFSENSDDFTDRGATMAEIWGDYYANYVPEMIRLVLPLAIFSACLFLVGQLSERLEITSLKAAGISLYRLFLPFLAFGILMTAALSTLDAWVIPESNKERIAFEDEYIRQKNEDLDRSDIYRELSPESYLQVNYFDKDQQTAYRIRMVEFDDEGVQKILTATNMAWLDDKEQWRLTTVQERVFSDSGFVERNVAGFDTLLSIFPQDLARSSSDIYQLSYVEAFQYIDGIKRSGASGIEIPQVQLFARMAYPFSILVVLMIGFAVAAVRRSGGKGFYIASGLVISFMYLVIMKIMEPFGALGILPPLWAAIIPHLLFFLIGIIGLKQVQK